MKIKEIKLSTPIEKTPLEKPQKRDLKSSRDRNKLLREQRYAENKANAELNKGKRGRPKKEPPKPSNRKGEIREAQNELTSVLQCMCGASYVHTLTNETNTEEEKSAYVCSNHNKGCNKKNPQRKLDADYLEFVVRSSLFIAIKVGKPIPIYFKDQRSEMTSIEAKVRKCETDSLTIEDFIKSEPSVRRILLMMTLKKNCILIEDDRGLWKDAVLRCYFTNNLYFEIQLYEPNKHSISDMNFYVYEFVRRDITTKDGRVIRAPSEKVLLESGTFHSDHTITFTHHSNRPINRKYQPLSYPNFDPSYWDNISKEIETYIKECENITDDFRKQYSFEKEEKERLIKEIVKTIKGMGKRPNIDFIQRRPLSELKNIPFQFNHPNSYDCDKYFL